VVGAHDQRDQQDGVAPVTGETLVNYCRENLASFKKPKSVHILPELPKNAYGKVLRRELKARFGKA
jgi:long-chain acyl-CoA synthetase